MSTEKTKGIPVINPVLTLQDVPRPKAARGGGKSASHIVQDRLVAQQAVLGAQARTAMQSSGESKTYAGRFPLWVKMFNDSLAQSYTPSDLFSFDAGNHIVAAHRNGYVVDTAASSLRDVIAILERPRTVKHQVDISRVKSIVRFDQRLLHEEQPLDKLWSQATPITLDRGELRAFNIWLIPFFSTTAKAEVRHWLTRLLVEAFQSIAPIIGGTSEEVSTAALPGGWTIASLAERLNDRLSIYEAFGLDDPLTVLLPASSSLRPFVASGAVFRLDPVYGIAPPTAGREPDPGPPPSDIDGAPIVGLVDGGVSSRMYKTAEAWSCAPFVKELDTVHGNKMASLIVDASGWNKRIGLPDLKCRFGTVPVVPKIAVPCDVDRFLILLEKAFRDHSETHVWNFSFNEMGECDAQKVSVLGHGIGALARKYNKLPVISVGNRARDQVARIAPPGDCEAALVIAGRDHNYSEGLAGPCPVSRCGIGPAGMWKPDLSYYSRLRMLGGAEQVGSSYATALISRVAAHTWSNLKHPTPDLVRALILVNADKDEFDLHLGWGSPTRAEYPWLCRPGSATMAWVSRLRSGIDYYWNDIVIPPTMIKNGKIFGTISLVAILRPLVKASAVGNYFTSRVVVSLQNVQGSGKVKNVLGTMDDDLPEQVARDTDFKWHPTRRHSKTFVRGTSIDGATLRLRSRVYLRDRFTVESDGSWDDDGEYEVAYALRFQAPDENEETYSKLVAAMRSRVDSAVIAQDIEVEW